MSFLEKLNWRYSTKKFDTNKPVSEADKEKIMEAMRLAPSSYGYQPYHITVVESKDLREQLKNSAYGQVQFVDAPLLFVFSSRNDLPTRIDEYLDMMTGGDGEKRTTLKGYEDMMKGAASTRNEEQAGYWAAKQAYISLGFGLAAAAELGLDSCPMEGFDAKAFKDILGLPDNHIVQAALVVGYRVNDEDKKLKVRFPKEELFSVK